MKSLNAKGGPIAANKGSTLRALQHALQPPRTAPRQTTPEAAAENPLNQVIAPAPTLFLSLFLNGPDHPQ
jgi:hypothetical protein